jgi:hypothetical protein
MIRRLKSWWRARVFHSTRSLLRTVNGRVPSAWQGLRR